MGGYPKEDPGGRKPRGVEVGIGWGGSPRRTRGGSPGGLGWVWVWGEAPERPGGWEPRGVTLKTHIKIIKKTFSNTTKLLKLLLKTIGGPTLPRRLRQNL